MFPPSESLAMAGEEEKICEVGGGESVFSAFSSSGSSSNSSTDESSTECHEENEEEEEEDDDFIPELTRQMAENMLQEDDGDGDEEQTPPSLLPNINYKHSFSNQESKKYSQHRQQQNKEYWHRRGGFPSSVQQPAGSGMRVVFLGQVGSGNESSGTGVFLPHLSNTQPDHQSRKKPGWSTVLIPERVLQTLQHHFEKRNAQAHLNGGPLIQQSQQLQPLGTPETIMNNQDLQLPQEWTY